ncbi:MAG: putative DNA binding domain-containing protein [Bacteroidetes bacterium]|nr:putative DNA binding domain-containing protein [Bacteroidota bacterium]
MMRDEDIQQRLELGEDSRWEFKRVEFSGRHPTSPSRDDLAAEMIAFANANGGQLLMSVTDDGLLQDLTREQMDALDNLVVEVSTDAIKPNLRINVYRRKLDGKAFVLVEVPRGDSLCECGGRSWIRVGASKRRLTGDEPMRLAQWRAQGRHLSFDGKPVAKTGFETLDPALWRPMLSAEDATEPEVALAKLALLASDESGVQCATVAGVLLCTRHPEQWLPNATISATRYRGTDRTTGQVDSREITGPLQHQIADALTFAGRNMQVAARKTPARIDMPQYSEKAIFEAVVNAAVHRDYSIRDSRIRLSVFSDRLEIQSPGALPNSLTLESMALRQATRNEIITSVMGRMGVGDIRGSADRRYFMEHRGDGVPTIIRETRELSGRAPEYRLIDDAEVLLRILAAPQDSISSCVVVTVRVDGQPLPGANVLALFPNRTWEQAVTDENGEATVDLYTTELPMTVFGAALGHTACLVREWLPATGALALDLTPLPQGGSVIFAEATGHLPGLKGRLNPIRDALDRTYLYASNLSVDRGRAQPVPFVPGEVLRLTDSDGVERHVRIVEIIGRSALGEYWVPGLQE